jgi:hypothetical protein
VDLGCCASAQLALLVQPVIIFMHCQAGPDDGVVEVQARLEKMQAHVVGLTTRLQQARLPIDCSASAPDARNIAASPPGRWSCCHNHDAQMCNRGDVLGLGPSDRKAASAACCSLTAYPVVQSAVDTHQHLDCHTCDTGGCLPMPAGGNAARGADAGGGGPDAETRSHREAGWRCGAARNRRAQAGRVQQSARSIPPVLMFSNPLLHSILNIPS